MKKSKFLRMFALIELMTAAMFIALAVVFYVNREAIAGDLMIPIVFAVIGGCALIAAPVLFKLAKKHDAGDIPGI